jgi:hypothetical protein
MGLEGLQVILDKEAVVPTPTTDRLVNAPEVVEAAFLHHVRSYVPFGRAGSDDDDGISVSEYEQRLIDKVRVGGAPKGYITADFGYGKTSTALYLWERCRGAGLLAVPPFQLGRLDDLVHASYGWARYEIGRRTPSVVNEVEALYRAAVERSVERDADGDVNVAERLRSLVAAGRLSMQLVATDYLTFFERLSDLAKQAGFTGLVILPDEIQQYLDPAIRSGFGDPIAPLHNIVEAFNTRRGRLPVGLILVMPRKELGVINDQRGDLVQRLKADQLGLDLSTVYDKRFASRLWQQLAREFNFEAEAGRIAVPATLDALGQIAARDDLASGPRTVVAAFAEITRRFLDADDGRIAPATPLDLVDAFLAGRIVFDNTSKLQAVVQERLSTPLVAERPEFRAAIKALAAFPTDGATREVLRSLDLWERTEELNRLAQGDLTIMVGGGRDERGEPVPYGYTLRGLEPQSPLTQDWLTQTLREFSRDHYIVTSPRTIERAEEAFVRLLTDIVFRAPNWKRVESTSRRKTDGANRSILLEGSFPATTRRFPERRVLVRLLREDEKPDANRPAADVTLDIVLARMPGVEEDERRRAPGELAVDPDGVAQLTLNLFHRETEDYYPDLQATLQPVVSPYRVTPLLLLTLHEYLEEKRRAALIPKEDEREITQFYQPRLLEHSLDELLNAALGSSVEARGARVIEQVFRTLLERRYPTYRTLIRQQNWINALKEYHTALERLSSRHERQGVTPYLASKEETARLFNRTNTALDSFIETFPDLITVTPPFRGREQSQVRFSLHPFEEQMLKLLRAGQERRVSVSGRTIVVRSVPLAQVREAGSAAGYREREVAALIDLLEKRELAEVSTQHDTLQEVPRIEVTAQDVAGGLDSLTTRIEALLSAFPDDAMVRDQCSALDQVRQQLGRIGAQSESATLVKFDHVLRLVGKKLDTLVEGKLQDLRTLAKSISIESASDPRREYRLVETVEGGLFAPQLDATRMRLLSETEEFIRRRDQLKTRILASVGQLNAERASDEGAIRGKQLVSELTSEAASLQKVALVLDQRGRLFAAARRVLAQAVELDGRLSREVATDDDTLRSAFCSLVDGIRAEWSSRKDEALASAEDWELRLVELRNRLNERLDAAKDQFEHMRAHYAELLHIHVRLPRGADRLAVVFNPADPVGSYDALGTAVVRLILQPLERILGLMEQARAMLRQILASGDIVFLDEAATYEEGARELIAISERLSAESQQLIDVCRHADAKDPSTLTPVFSKAAELLEQVETFMRRLEQAKAAVSLRALDDTEQVALRVLRAMFPGGESGHASVDVGAVLDNPALVQSAPDGDVWHMLERLYRKRRVSLTIGLAAHQ